MQDFSNLDYLNSALTKGAFIVSGDNVMTASWGLVGKMWGKKVYVAPIRDSRYTKEFLDKTGEFTVSVPFENQMQDELKICGTKSGRDTDQWAVANLKKVKAQEVDTVIVDGCQKYLECKVLGVVPMGDMDMSKVSDWYKTGDMHNFYFGEVVKEY